MARRRSRSYSTRGRSNRRASRVSSYRRRGSRPSRAYRSSRAPTVRLELVQPQGLGGLARPDGPMMIPAGPVRTKPTF